MKKRRGERRDNIGERPKMKKEEKLSNYVYVLHYRMCKRFIFQLNQTFWTN